MRRGWFKVGIPALVVVVLVAGSVFAGATLKTKSGHHKKTIKRIAQRIQENQKGARLRCCLPIFSFIQEVE